MQQLKQAVESIPQGIKQAAESAPAASAAVATIGFGVTLNEMVAIMSLVVLATQWVVHLFRLYRDWKRNRDNKPEETTV